MKVLLCELDGTTWEHELPQGACTPQIYAPIFPSRLANSVICADGTLTATFETVRTRRYQLAAISDDIAFYDRIVDPEEIR